MKIGFIGQGYVGKNYADYFDDVGHQTVRYSLDTEYLHNKNNIAECKIVFIAVPTPTKPSGFDSSFVEEALTLVGDGATVVVKSTLIPGTTARLQSQFKNIFLFHSPEFLSRDSAREDVRSPRRKIIGMPIHSQEYINRAEELIALLPEAPYKLICDASTAELLKYANNTFFYTKIVFMNILYDLVQAQSNEWGVFREALGQEPWIGAMHIDPVHKSGRGAGGDCMIKDFAAFKKMYSEVLSDDIGLSLLELIEKKNISLLKTSGKDFDLLKSIYGEDILSDITK